MILNMIKTVNTGNKRWLAKPKKIIYDSVTLIHKMYHDIGTIFHGPIKNQYRSHLFLDHHFGNEKVAL